MGLHELALVMKEKRTSSEVCTINFNKARIEPSMVDLGQKRVPGRTCDLLDLGSCQPSLLKVYISFPFQVGQHFGLVQ